MTNREKLKKAIDKDINLEDYYNEIVNQIEREDKMNNNVWKWSLVPICLMVIISGILLLNYQNNKEILRNRSYVDEKNNIIFNINEVTNKLEMYRIDADVKVAAMNGVNFPLPYKNVIDIPKDLNKTDSYIIYFREDKESKEYNILGNYEIIYGSDNGRSISVKYSKEHKPVRDYYFSEEGSKKTTINNVDLKIYKFENIYFTEFEFNDYNFDIETSNITEQELLNLLLSILK